LAAKRGIDPPGSGLVVYRGSPLEGRWAKMGYCPHIFPIKLWAKFQLTKAHAMRKSSRHPSAE
jgi:hypothetical protein